MTEAVGPVWTGGFEYEDSQGYRVQYLPDKHNDQLQKEGKAPVYYWMPVNVRLARKDGTGDYKFHLVHFVGVLDSDTTVGVKGKEEVAGGVLSFTTTSAFPAGVLERAEQQLLERFRGKDDKYWGWRTSVAPMFRAVPITANITSITNLSPDAKGNVPAATGGPAPATSTSGSTGSSTGSTSSAPPRSLVRAADLSRPVLHGRAFRSSPNIEAWHWNMQGQGNGSIIAGGENAYSGLIGDLPAAIVWQGFHGTYSPIAVVQALKIPVWSQALKINIRGNWDRIFEHFSAHGKVDTPWFDADIKVQFNNMRTSGGITVSLEIDGTMPGADKMEQEATKRIDIIYQKFMDEAKKVIFEPALPKVDPAQASGGGGLLGWGGALALNYRRDSTKLELDYNENYDKRYNLDHVISSTLEGFYDEIKNDPDAERKYFTTLHLEDWSRKVTRIVKPVVNWPDPTKKWIGDPVSFLSVELGYPSARGDIQWAPHVFQSTDTGDTTRWEMAVSKKKLEDVTNPPEGWTPDKMFVRRRVHLNEPQGESDSPFMRVFVEKDVIELDPGENGRLTNLNILEVRADSVGKLEVGPINIDAELENSKQVIDVEFQCLGNRHDGLPRNITRFQWKFEDYKEPRYWEIFTGQLDFIPKYQYRVTVTVKGTIFSKGMSWTGPWKETSGNGPLMVSVPTSEDAGVTRRSLFAPAAQSAAASSGNGSGSGSSTGSSAGSASGVGRPPAKAGIGGPAKRTVSELMGSTAGLPMRELAPAPAASGAEATARTAGGYSLEPATSRLLPDDPPPVVGQRERFHPDASSPAYLELAEGWKTNGGSNNGS